MARRRKRKSKQIKAAAAPKAASPKAGAQPSEAATPAAPQGPVLIAWRRRMLDLLDTLRTWSRDQYGALTDAHLAECFGDSLEGSAGAPQAADLRRATDDFVCSPGSAGEGASIVQRFCEDATTHGCGDLSKNDITQMRRWERERHRGVFLIQGAERDQLSLWDPLEGAPITLHLLEKLPAAQLPLLGRGTVVTAVYQPWMARLIAVGTEFFTDAKAIKLFREQTQQASAEWHDAPAPAPSRSRSAATKA